MFRRVIAALSVVAFVGACSGGSGGGDGGFQLVQFLESGKDTVVRNKILTFTFSEAVQDGQDFAERIKIQNVQIGGGNSNFARAIGDYVVSADTVTFIPRLPQLADRSDAGLREDGSYVVFLKSGSDSLISNSGRVLGTQQEFNFDTGANFEDPLPSEPPRTPASQSFVATDPVTGAMTDLSRLDPRPDMLASRYSNTALYDASRVIDPGATSDPRDPTAAPYSTPWQLDLRVSEPLDPQSVTPANVEMFELEGDVFADEQPVNPNQRPAPGSQGTVHVPAFRVPIKVQVVQSYNANGDVDAFIRVTPQQTLVDNARYRLVFSGNILGLDFRQQFVGDNGLTGDDETMVREDPTDPTSPLIQIDEPGGQGYTTEFLVANRPAISGSRTLTYDPLEDGILPESGLTTNNPDDINSALYNPANNSGRAVGFLSAFGDGTDGDKSVSGGNTEELDTGDTLNPPLEDNPTFSVFDPDVNDRYSNQGLPPSGLKPWDNPVPTEYNWATLTISSSSTLRFKGVNAVRIRVSGTVQISGTLDVSGLDAGAGGTGGDAGAAGFKGGNTRTGGQLCPFTGGNCATFDSYLNGCQAAKNQFPYSLKGEGPGRGQEGGETYLYYARNHLNEITATGGGGGGHGTPGTDGEDRSNAGSDGTAGPNCGGQWRVPNSSVIGVRGRGGESYGDEAVLNNLRGGSGGGGGGSNHQYQFSGTPGRGGAGGGGGGVVEIIAAGQILVAGGRIDASGGDGFRGVIITPRSGWEQATGAGGGGAGGSIVLISGADINLSNSESGVTPARPRPATSATRAATAARATSS
jgi:hypothetical protein